MNSVEMAYEIFGIIWLTNTDSLVKKYMYKSKKILSVVMDIKDDFLIFKYFLNEPRREKTGFLRMRKQRRRSASR